MPQSQPRQQSGLSDIPMLQQHIMFKQLQELQRQRQLQGIGNGRQQNHANQLSLINKQSVGCQLPPLINGTPIHDTSQLNIVGNTNLVQCSTPSVIQGFPNGLVLSQAQNQALRSMGFVPQQLDVSLYGTPVSSTNSNSNLYSQFQGAYHDKLVEKTAVQPSDSFINDQFNVSSDQVCTLNGAFTSQQVFQEKHLYDQVSNQGFQSGGQLGNFHLENTLQRKPSPHEVGPRQEQGFWPGLFPDKTTKIGSSQGLSLLDPLEEKILFNTDDSWESSFGRHSNVGAGGFDSTLDNSGGSSTFPSVQSGSWSALMQSAVAEASSSETGLKEEWSGISFQNPKLSTDNQPANFMGSGKQQIDMVDNNLQSASTLTSKSAFLFNNSNMNFSFHQQANMQLPMKQRDGMCSDSSHESIHQSPKYAYAWVDCSSLKNPATEGSHLVQTPSPSQYNVQSDRIGKHSESAMHPSNSSTYDNHSQPYNYLKDGAAYKNSGTPWKAGDSYIPGSTDREDCQLNDFAALPNSSRAVVDHTVNLETRLSGDCLQRENSNDSYHSNASQQTVTNQGVRENFLMHESDFHHVAGGQRNSIGQVFYKQVPRGLTNQGEGYVDQFKFVGSVPNSEMDVKKGNMSDVQRNPKASPYLPPRNTFGSVPGFSDRSLSFHGSITAQTWEQRTERLSEAADSSPMPEMPQTQTPDASSEQSYHKSIASHNFGLKLARSCQMPDKLDFSESFQGYPELGNNSAALASGPLCLRNQFQSQHVPAAPHACQSPKATLPDMASRLLAFNSATTHPVHTSYSQQVPILDTAAVSQPCVVSNLQKPPAWANSSTQHFSGRQPFQGASSLHPSPDSTNSTLDTTSVAPHELHNQNSFNRRNRFQQTGGGSMHSQDVVNKGEKEGKQSAYPQIVPEIPDTTSRAFRVLHGQESMVKLGAQHSESQNPAISVRDLVAFGHSLKPTPITHQNEKNVAIDRSNTDLARNVISSGIDVSHISPFSSGDNEMLGFSSDAKGDYFSKASSQTVLGYTPQEMSKIDQNDSQSHSGGKNVVSNKTEDSQIGLPMAPNWFKHCKTLKNGQLPMYDARAAKNAVQQFSLRKPHENFQMHGSTVLINSADGSQVNSLLPSASTNSAVVKLSSPCFVLSPDVIDPNLSVLRPKKRKFAEFQLLPWYKELAPGSQTVQNIRTAEMDWAQATNRLTDKVDDKGEIIENALPILRPKKRLILTTQLMQHVFRAAPSYIFSADATSNCDSVAYFTARLALGDACSLTIDSHSAFDPYNMSFEKPDPSEGVSSQNFSKIVEDIINRAKSLESDLLRLDNKVSILDTRLESQELEKFSIINRFAKFHTRGQAGPAEMPSSSGSTPAVMRTSAQRYVTALPMPKTVPDGVQCLSL